MHHEAQQQTSAIGPVTVGQLLEVSRRQPYFTIRQFCERNSAFTEPAIRNLIFKAEPRESTRGTIPGNGLIECGAIVRLGRKVLIHEERFFAWVEAQGAGR